MPSSPRALGVACQGGAVRDAAEQCRDAAGIAPAPRRNGASAARHRAHAVGAQEPCFLQQGHFLQQAVYVGKATRLGNSQGPCKAGGAAGSELAVPSTASVTLTEERGHR